MTPAPVVQAAETKKKQTPPAHRFDQVVIKEFETQAVNSIVAGFMFASAVSWMDVTRWIISRFIKINKNGGQYYLLTAMATTLLGILVFLSLKRLSPTVMRPASPVYSVGGRGL